MESDAGPSALGPRTRAHDEVALDLSRRARTMNDPRHGLPFSAQNIRIYRRPGLQADE